MHEGEWAIPEPSIRARFVAPSAVLLGEKIEIGKGCWVGFNVLIDGQADRVVIEEGCEISSFAYISTHSTHLRCTGRGEKVVGPVTIEAHTYIGPYALLEPNTKIGHHSIVGAYARVRGEFSPLSFIVGNPARRREYPCKKGRD